MKAAIFIDSDVFVALYKNNDSSHKKSVRLFEQAKKQSTVFLTSNYVFLESITVISQKVGHIQAANYISTMKSDDNGFLIKRIDEELEAQAIEIFKKQTSKNTSFVDCANIALIKDMKLDGVFSFDQIYRKNGIKLLEDLFD